MLRLSFGTNQKIPALVSKFLLTGAEPASVIDEYANLKEPIPSAIKVLVEHGLEVHFVQLDYEQNLLSVVCREYDELQTGKAFGALCLIPGLTPYQQTFKSVDGKKFTEITFTNNEKPELGEICIPHALKAWDDTLWSREFMPFGSVENCLELGPSLPYCADVCFKLRNFARGNDSLKDFEIKDVEYKNPNFKPYTDGTSYHHFLLAGSKKTGEIYIVDPSYQQFVPEEEHFYLPKIMVISCSSLEAMREGLLEYEIPEKSHYFWLNQNTFKQIESIKSTIPNPESAFFG